MPPLCIPQVGIVPGLSGPPNWLDAPPNGRKQIDDPRWVGAYSQGFGFGTAEEATFRALNHVNGAQTSLYLSWHVKFENTPSPDQDTLYIGFTRTAHPPLLLKIVPYGAPGNVTLDAVPAADMVVGSRVSAAGPTNGQLNAFGNVPSWVTDNLRIWHSPGDMDWAVHLRVPIKPGAALEDPAGIDLSATFKMWYCYDIFTPTRAQDPGDPPSSSGIVGGVLRLTWPSNALLTYTTDFVYPDPNSVTAPWLEYNLGSSGTPCSTGVGISLIGYTSIGTNTPGVTDGEIKTSPTPPQPTNTFYAQPTNNSGSAIPVGALKARFRLANWGAVANRNLAPWPVIGQAQNSAVIANGATAPINVVNLLWAPPQAWVSAMSLPTSDPNYKDDHQCMLVELSGAGLTFSVSSRYRNMNFVPNSTYSRQAEINIFGLKPISFFRRDVYLAVEALNLPAQVDDPGAWHPRALTAEAANATATLSHLVTHEQARDRVELVKEFVANYYVSGLDKEYNMPIEDLLDATLPTYRVHMYYDTGQRQTIKGQTHIILGLGSSFGLYGITPFGAEVEGWEHRLQGALRIAENFYLLRVPNGGKAHVSTTLQSRAPGETPLPDVPIQRWPEPTPLAPTGCPVGCLMVAINLFKRAFSRLRRQQ